MQTQSRCTYTETPHIRWPSWLQHESLSAFTGSWNTREARLSFIRNKCLVPRPTGHQEDVWPWCTAARSPAGRSRWRVCGPPGRTEPSVAHHTQHYTLQPEQIIQTVISDSTGTHGARGPMTIHREKQYILNTHLITK